MTEAEKMEVARIVKIIEIGKRYEDILEVVDNSSAYNDIKLIASKRAADIINEAYKRIEKLFDVPQNENMYEKYFPKELYDEVWEIVGE